jgi:hypothetical protein
MDLPRWAVVVEATGTEASKKCYVCHRYLTLDSYHRHAKKPDGLKDECKECMGRYHVSRADVVRRAREKWEIVHDRRPSLKPDGDAGQRLRAFAETGAGAARPSERDAAARLRAFASGTRGIYRGGE